MKRVIFPTDSPKTVVVTKCEAGRIYAFNVDSATCKLFEASQGQWIFIDMSDSECGYNGMHDSMEIALRSAQNQEIYEFDNELEYHQWAVKMLSKE